MGKLVVARVLSVTTKDKGAETDGANENSTPVLRLSLKGSRVQGDAAKEAVFQSLLEKQGKRVTGIVKRVDENHGVFVAVHTGGAGADQKDTEVVGLARRHHVMPHESTELMSSKYSPGDIVRCLVMKVDITRRR